MLELDNVARHFGGVKAVDGLSLKVEPGEILGLIGPNGSGKSTTVNLIAGLYRPSSGTVRFQGQEISALSTHKRTELGIARTFQNIELFEYATVLQNLLIGGHVHRKTGFLAELFFTSSARRGELHAREDAERIIEFLDLQRYRDTLVAGLPYGVRKVVELARALCTRPKLLLLDEPSSGLNVEETDGMAFWIQDIKNELGITVLMVEHDMTLVSKVSDRVLAMNQGEKLAIGTPREVQSDPRVIEAYLGSAEDMSFLRRPQPFVRKRT